MLPKNAIFMKKNLFLMAIVTILFSGCNEKDTLSPLSDVTGKTDQIIADFSYTTFESDARRVQFTNKSSSALYNFSWDFGDGDTSTEKNPEKLYWRNGQYVVTLTAWGRDSQQKYVREKTISIHSDEPDLMSNIYIKGFKLYNIPSDGRYYRFSVVAKKTLDDKASTIINSGYTPKLYNSDLPKSFVLQAPVYINILLNMVDYEYLMVYVYQSTDNTKDGTQCLKQIFLIEDDDCSAWTYREEYVVASDNGQTRVGVLMDWSDE